MQARRLSIAVLGPILGVLILYLVFNFGVNQMRSDEERFEEFGTVPLAELLSMQPEESGAVTETAEITAAPAVAAPAAEVTDSAAVTAPAAQITASVDVTVPAAEITATAALTATGPLTSAAVVTE